MEGLPKDINREILLNLSPPDIINFCLTNKEKKTIICDSNEFWFKKLEKDYPSELRDHYKYGTPVNAKNRYIKRFTYVSKNIENIVTDIKHTVYGVLNSKYLNKTYDDDLYRKLYEVYTAFKEYLEKIPVSPEDQNIRNITPDVSADLIAIFHQIIPENTPLIPRNYHYHTFTGNFAFRLIILANTVAAIDLISENLRKGK